MSHSIIRFLVTLSSIIITITVLALAFTTEFPWWAGFLIALVVLFPIQIYLNKTKSQQRLNR